MSCLFIERISLKISKGPHYLLNLLFIIMGFLSTTTLGNSLQETIIFGRKNYEIYTLSKKKKLERKFIPKFRLIKMNLNKRTHLISNLLEPIIDENINYLNQSLISYKDKAGVY